MQILYVLGEVQVLEQRRTALDSSANRGLALLDRIGRLQRVVELLIAEHHDAVIVAEQNLARIDLDLSEANRPLNQRRLVRPDSPGNRTQGVNRDWQLGEGGGVSAEAVDDDAGHATPYRFGCEELTQHGVLSSASLDDEDVAGAAVLQTGQYGHEVGGCGNGNGSADHANAASVRAQLAWQDAERLVGVGQAGSIELPDLGWDLAGAH